MTTPLPQRLPPNFFDDARPFRIDGAYCKLIPLTQGQFAIVDQEDYEWISKTKWRVTFDPHTHGFYAIATVKGSSVIMHRQILGLAKGDPRQGDHRASGETLDNRRKNLRISSHAQNSQNQRLHRDSGTGLKGVTEFRGRFSAHIRVAGKLKFLGSRESPEEAHKLYSEAAKREFGEFANCGERRRPELQ